MKKVSKLIVAIIVVLSICGFSLKVNAEDKVTTTTVVNGISVEWSYELNDNNQIINLVCNNVESFSGKMTIPGVIDGKTVIEIGGHAFDGCTQMTELVIPDTVKKIRVAAFADCTKLVNVDLGKVKSFSSGVFQDCTSLQSIVIPKTLINGSYLAPGSFKGCTNLTNVTFEEGITKIAEGILKDAKSVTKITIPDSVIEIGSNAFCDSGLTEIIIPNKVKDIGISAFEGTNLVEVEIPTSVSKISTGAFKNCSKLIKITILDTVQQMGLFDNQTDSNDVFGKNHHEDLTIYCYEGSTAAEHAKINKIKYVYLQKPSEETPPAEEQPKDPSTPTDDGTQAPGEIPNAGLEQGIIITIISILIVSVFTYNKTKKYRGI